eukprot:113917_1
MKVHGNLLDKVLVLHRHLQLLVRLVMRIVMELMQVVHIYMKMIITDHGMKLPFAIIGAFGDENSNGINAGSAYIYENDNNGSWNEVSKLIASDGAASDNFGVSVSIAPPFAIIGAFLDDNSNGIEAGSAY